MEEFKSIDVDGIINQINLFVDTLDMVNICDQSYFINYNNEINNIDLRIALFKEHSWQQFIFTTNPIRIDNSTLLKNQDICIELAKAISYYNKTLIRLIEYRINEGDYYDQDKWNSGIEKIKSLLYTQVKEIIGTVPNSNIPEEAKDYIERCISTGSQINKEFIDSFSIPKNILNNFISNTKRNLNKSKK